jgi:retron-type reverse transcriptase
MQALHALALKPIVETIGDRNSYGFREGRSCADAIGQCFCALAKSYAPVWVLEGDIKACFDEIDHTALVGRVRHRIGDKRVLGLVTHDDQIKQVDTLIKQHLANNPEATVDDALDAIFTVGINVIEAATL